MAAAPGAVKNHDRQPGFAPGAEITVKGADATREQKDNLSRVIDVGISLGLKPDGASVGRLILVAAVMTVTVESSARNLNFGDLDSLGLFQQRPSQGWGTPDQVRDPAHAAQSFYSRAITYMAGHPHTDAAALAQAVQGSAYPERYGVWRAEAEHTINAYFGLDDSTSPAANDIDQDPATGDGNLGFFVRGRPKTINGHRKVIRESNWACLQRLAQEVQWRCFCVSGTVYFCSDGHLFQSQPRMTISEDTDGVDWIDYQWDTGKKNATVTVQCRVSRWQAPPGSVVAIEKSGPINGRWLVTGISRSVFNTAATVTLTKPMPVIAEKLTPEFSKGDATGGTLDLSGQKPGSTTTQQQFQVATTLVNPIPEGMDGHHGAVHPTAGLADYPALDFFAKPGTPVVAPETGKIERFSGHDPSLGPIGPNGFHGSQYAGGPLGWSIYLRGDVSGTDYYLTHLGSRSCVEGQHVLAGQQIATVADYDKWASKGFSHTHVGVNGGSVTIETLGSAPQAVKR